MSVIDDYRRKLSSLAAEHINLLGDIADAESRLNRLKKEVTESYEKIDDILDLEIDNERTMGKNSGNIEA